MSPWLVVTLALTTAGSVGTLPVRGGLTGLLAGSVVAGYWQSAPTLAGGLNGGNVIGGPGVAVMTGKSGLRSSRAVLTLRATTTNTALTTTTRMASAVVR